MNVWLLGVAGLLAVSRPNVARVRVGALAAERDLGRAVATRDVTPWWHSRPAAGLRLLLLRPHRSAGIAGAVMLLVTFLTGLRLPVGMAAGLVAAVALDGALGAIAAHRARRNESALANALGVLESELVAGAREDAALVAAAALAGPLGPQLREAAALTGYGDETVRVLARSDLLRPLSAAWRVRQSCGAPLAEVVAQVAGDVELHRKRTLAVDTALAGPRSSSALLAGLPLVGAGLGIAMGAHPGHFLFSTPTGSLVLLVGVGLDVAGWLWTEAMVRRARR